MATFTLVPSAQRRAIQSDQLSIASALKGNQMTLVMATAVDMICPLPDFGLFRLIPNGGLYVLGFGQAFEVSPDMKNSRHATGDNIGTRPD